MRNVVSRRRVARYRRVLIPLDGSRLAENIIPYILNIAEALYMDVVLVRVVVPTAAPLTAAFAEGGDDVKPRMTAAHNYLAEVAAGFWRQGVRVQTKVRFGKPITEICAAARELAADLIAMSTRNRSRLAWPSTSVAEGVLRCGDTPVFLMQMQQPSRETGRRGTQIDQGAERLAA